MTRAWGKDAVILDRYRLESLLGQGGMGSVWRAEHLQLKAPVAIKLLDPSIADDPVMLARFLREAQSAASLRSPNVVQIFDYGVEDGKAFIAMELLQGEPLSERITRLGRLPPDEAFRFVFDVLRAIGKAHEAGIVHRDLKPDNIFLCKDEPEFAKILDFGVAKLQKPANGPLSSRGALSISTGGVTQTGMMIGTPYYMSPEQTQAKDVDERADLWAIAVIAFEALTGRRPFLGESFGELVIAICTAPTPVPSDVAPVPAGFDEWFVHATQRDRSRRFRSAREMAEELQRVAAGEAKAGGSYTGRHRSITPMIMGSSASPPRASTTTGGGVARSSDDLKLTTGQRAVLSRGSANRPTGGMSPALVALLGAGALIVAGVGVFVLGGGARAFRDSQVALSAESLPSAAPDLIESEPVRSAVASPVVAPAQTPPPVASVASSATASASARLSIAKPGLARPRTAPGPVPAAAPGKDPLPPKNWEF